MTKFKKAVNVKSLYNTLETLIKVGAVQQFVDNRTINYELTINNSFHLHVIDQDSQKHSIIDDPDLVKDIVSLISKKHKLTLKS